MGTFLLSFILSVCLLKPGLIFFSPRVQLSKQIARSLCYQGKPPLYKHFLCVPFRFEFCSFIYALWFCFCLNKSLSPLSVASTNWTTTKKKKLNVTFVLCLERLFGLSFVLAFLFCFSFGAPCTSLFLALAAGYSSFLPVCKVLKDVCRKVLNTRSTASFCLVCFSVLFPCLLEKQYKKTPL